LRTINDLPVAPLGLSGGRWRFVAWSSGTGQAAPWVPWPPPSIGHKFTADFPALSSFNPLTYARSLGSDMKPACLTAERCTKHIRPAIVRRDKAEALGLVEPLHGTVATSFSPNRSFGYGRHLGRHSYLGNAISHVPTFALAFDPTFLNESWYCARSVRQPVSLNPTAAPKQLHKLAFAMIRRLST
jgi:hypothetical protein